MPDYHRLQGLYVLTDEHLLAPEGLHAAVSAAIEGGCQLVQYRDKHSSQSVRRQQAQRLNALCQRNDITFIINDDIELAIAVNADGIHIGKHDASLEVARSRLDDSKIIGVSCYNDFGLAKQAEQQGADYVAFGSFYSSTTKPDAVKADLQLLQKARQELSIPVVAIGGINHHNANELIAAGADMIAVVSAVFKSSNVTESARKFSALFDQV